ncbi:MAG: hypothetical protein ACJ75F_04500 [Flavisolibacter sp.]
MYSVTVKIDGIVSRRKSAGVLHIVTGLFLIAKGAGYFKDLGYRNFASVMPVLLVGSFSLFYGMFRKKIDGAYAYNYWLRLLQVITFTILGLLLISAGGDPIDYTGVFVFALLSIVLMFSERKIFQETIIFFDEDGIKIPGYYRDHLVNWTDIIEVVVMEDFITIFHIREKYLQYQVMQDLSTLEVAKMNAFCRDKIEQSAGIEQE